MQLEKQLAENKRKLESLKSKGKDSLLDDSQSELTIYQNAVEKRGSSSSENNIIDLSCVDQLHDTSVIVECNFWEEHEIQPEQPDDQAAKSKQKLKDVAEEKADHFVKEDEASKVRIYDVSGNAENLIESEIEQICTELGRCKKTNSCYVDDDYMLVASHLDKAMHLKITNHEYVDFSKLLRRDHTFEEDQQRMMMINKGGMSFWVPVNDKSTNISSFAKWDQAFGMFLDMYSGKYLKRTLELIQYSHIIQTASYSYVWENVY